MNVSETALPGVLLLEPRRFGDGRGWFTESWSARTMEAEGLAFDWVQDNHSHSVEAGTVRGLHYQAPPMAQTKLVRVARGAVLDVAVDVRKGSPTYRQWITEELSEENGRQLLVPKGFLHGFVTLTPGVDVLYKVDAFYSGEHDGGVRFDDPDLGVNWGIDASAAVLSEKDAKAPLLADWQSPFVWEGA
ncbi:MAG: dTDP-4-dehydrorhamnose 3,5-epimerase [Pseudomonadota bacterium]